MANTNVTPVSLLRLLHDVHDLFAVLGVEVGGRLVSQDHLGIDGKRPGDRDALLLPAAES